MAREVNASGVSFAHACVSAGRVNQSDDWSFSAEDGNKLLGGNGDDWANYGKHFLAVNSDQPADTKAHYSYPFAKDDTLYRSALAAIRQRASQQNDDAVFAAAGSLLDLLGKPPGKAAGKLDRAYSILTIKEMDDSGDQRIIRGTATTPSTDRMGDIVEPLGVSFTNPMPLLWQHQSDQPVGQATFDKPTKDGISFTASVPKITEPGTLKDRLDEAWQSVKAGLVRAVSIGFRSLEHAVMKDGGYRFIKSEVVELSLVTIPANADATITLVRSIDAEQRAATGNAHRIVTRPASALATKQTPVVKAKPNMARTIAEQISAFEATRQSKAARMSELMDVSGEKGETLDTAQTEEYDGLADELKAIDAHLVRLHDHQKLNVAKAVAVDNVTDTTSGSRVRGSVAATVRAPSKLPPGIGFTRYVLALARAKGNLLLAERIAEANEQWKAETPEVLEIIKSAVASGTTTDSTWAGPLVQYQNLAAEFIDFLRPLTIIGRIPGLRRVPFKVKIPRQTGTSTANWVGEGQAKPVSALSFDSITLDPATVSDIVIITQQLASYSSPSAEMLVRDDLAAKITNFLDAQFVDPSVAVSVGVSPASITNGVAPTVATGTTADALRTDVGTLFETFLEANLQLNSAMWIMSQVTAARISLIRSSLGTKEYPEINVNGGTFEGLPVVTSQSVPATGGSPTDGYPIILLNAGDILLADEGQVRIDASAEATVQMDTSPDSPATGSTPLISFWQQGFMGIKADRDINWAKRRSTCVAYISNAKYTTG